MAKNNAISAIRAIEDKYGLILFRMGLTYVMDVGVRHLNNESVAESIQHIKNQGEEDKANGISKIMTPDFECDVVLCASELAEISIWDLFKYIKKYVVVD